MTFSMNVKMNIANKFLNLIDKHFPTNHKLAKVINRDNVKVSYSCLPNVASAIQAHNTKVLSDEPPTVAAKCNCRNKNSCPLGGNA